MFGIEEEPFRIQGKKYALAAYKHVPLNRKKSSVVLMLHGFTGNKVEAWRLFVDIARELCRNGFIVIRFDYRGHGESPGDFEDFKLEWALEDSELALRYSLSMGEYVGLIGLSLGGAVAIYLASILSNFIKAIVLLSPVINFAEVLNRRMDNFKKGVYSYIGPLRIKLENLMSLKSFNGFDYVTKIKAPTLIIHSKDDSIVPYSQALRFYKNLAVKKELLLLEKGGHTFNTYEARITVISRIVKWFLGNLK
mgnify:CR=1 FL=1